MRQPKVLFVDDDRNVLSGLRRALRSNSPSWQCEFVTSAPRALHRLQKTAFDVLVTDLRMPGMSGALLLDEVGRKYPDIVRVVLSGAPPEELQAKPFNVNVQYLSKPCHASALVAAVERGLILKHLFRDGKLDQLIEGLQSLSCFPELTIRILNAAGGNPHQPQAIAHICCPPLGIDFRLPLGRTALVRTCAYEVAGR